MSSRVSLGCAGLAALLVAGCSSSATSPTPSAPSVQATPSAQADARVATVTITAADGCQVDRTEVQAGALTVQASNKDATGISEVYLLQESRIVAEKENLAPGFSGSFSVRVEPGTYQIFCPGTGKRIPLTVTGTASSAPASDAKTLLTAGTKDYADYVSRQTASLLAAATTLATAIDKGDVTAAQVAYAKARPFYERIEPVAERFSIGADNLDAAIDARADDVPVEQLTGFHRIEKGLFTDKSTAGLSAYGKGLIANITKLQGLIKGLTYKPFEVANGAVGLLEEVQKSKMTGEEERYSHIDLLDFQANVEGSEQAFATLQPGLKLIDPTLTTAVAGAFDTLHGLLDRYRTTKQPSGFVLFPELTKAQITELSNGLQAVNEPLSRVAAKVVNY